MSWVETLRLSDEEVSERDKSWEAETESDDGRKNMGRQQSKQKTNEV